MAMTNGALARGEWQHGSIATEGAELVQPNGELWKVDLDALLESPANEGRA